MSYLARVPGEALYGLACCVGGRGGSDTLQYQCVTSKQSWNLRIEFRVDLVDSDPALHNGPASVQDILRSSEPLGLPRLQLRSFEG